MKCKKPFRDGAYTLCPACRAGPLRNNKPLTVQPNLPLTHRDDPEPRTGRSNGPIRTVQVREDSARSVLNREARDYILGQIKKLKSAGTEVFDALDAWEQELRG